MRILFFLMMTLLLAGCGGSNIDAFHDQALTSWTDLQQAYQDRANLMPIMAAVVDASTARGTDAVIHVTDAANAARHFNMNADILTDRPAFQKFEALQLNLEQAVAWMLTVSKNYPDLKTGQNFITLQKQLVNTDMRINNARVEYNRAAGIYNRELRTIHGRWWTKIAHSQTQPLQIFTLPDGEGRAAPAA